MRLQSAIFTLGDTLFTPDGAAREGLDKALSLFKMEGVWLGAVTALSAEDAQKALEKAGLNSYFRFVLTESVALCKADSGTMFERAMKRLHSQKDDTIVFSGSLAAIQNAKDAGFRTVAPGEKPQKGDVVVFQAIKGHRHGHVAMFDGKQWISDFKQDSIYAATDYQKVDAPYVIYRRP